jgi:hypothetical protein
MVMWEFSALPTGTECSPADAPALSFLRESVHQPSGPVRGLERGHPRVRLPPWRPAAEAESIFLAVSGHFTSPGEKSELSEKPGCLWRPRQQILQAEHPKKAPVAHQCLFGASGGYCMYSDLT